jgi:hypothetical protein
LNSGGIYTIGLNGTESNVDIGLFGLNTMLESKGASRVLLGAWLEGSKQLVVIPPSVNVRLTGMYVLVLPPVTVGHIQRVEIEKCQMICSVNCDTATTFQKAGLVAQCTESNV